MLEKSCVVIDRWTANQCFDHKEELVRIKVLRTKVSQGTRRQEDLLKMVRVRVRVVSSLKGPNVQIQQAQQ